MEPDDPRLVAAARHALHDEELVAAYAVDGDAAEDPAKARTLIERCTTCRDLHTDLVGIGVAVRAAGTAEAVAAVRSAPRDFRLTATDAVRLRGDNALQRVAARLVDGIASFGRPVGASLATLGVVGLLVGTATLGSIGAAPASAPQDGTGAPAAAPTTEGALGYQPESSATTDRSGASPQPRDSSEDIVTQVAPEDGASASSSGVPWLFAGSMALVVAGATLLLAGSRYRRRPLARPPSRT